MKSFKDTNGDGIGDLQGIIEKVDYLKQIGIDIIWLVSFLSLMFKYHSFYIRLNPIYPSGGYDNGYDVSSFTEIDPLYGTMNDFDDLLLKLHSKSNVCIN